MRQMKSLFKLKNLSSIGYYLGVTFERKSNQARFGAGSELEMNRKGFWNATDKLASTVIENSMDNFGINAKKSQAKQSKIVTLFFRPLAASLHYLNNVARPGILFSVVGLSSLVASPTPCNKAPQSKLYPLSSGASFEIWRLGASHLRE